MEAESMGKRLLSLNVNGRSRDVAAADQALLLEVLRDGLQLTGTKQGCDGGECGACTVLVDSQPRLACITLAAQVEGHAIETIEGLVGGGRTSPHGRSEGRVPPRGDGPQGQGGRISALQQAFHEKLGTQCGYCTPGMVMAAEALLRREPNPTEAQIREALAGNLCRCTGYVKIIESVQCAAQAERGREPAPAHGSAA
jgi:4-hydroxybenzoyl-CoA reductase subunit gamma